MSGTKKDEPLILSMAGLKHADPMGYENFIVCLSERAYRTMEMCVASDDKVSVIQGRARELNDLLVLLRDADKTAQKIGRA